jgi:IMP dehydrogenase
MRIGGIMMEAKKMQQIRDGITFDDVLLIPAYSNVLPNEVSLKTRLTKNITLNIPIISAAMDTVTDSEMAIALAMNKQPKLRK